MTSNDVYYIVSHKPDDTSIEMLKRVVRPTLTSTFSTEKRTLLLSDPLAIQILLANISFETSKYHMKRFQRFMWAQFKQVDDHFYGSAIKEKHKLELLTKELQVVSYNAASHIANATIAAINASALQELQVEIIRLSANAGDSECYQKSQQESLDTIKYVRDSMEKQKMWFENYKQRKDTTMGLVFNLVTQQDAANNIAIAGAMKQDSSSMKAIAALTMFFLPGTFTAVRPLLLCSISILADD